MEPKFTVPDDVDVVSLLVSRLEETSLSPSTPVICINRGRVPLTETFDGRHIQIPPGLFETEYGAALHFQTRLIVKGTRNLEVGGYVSWIGIFGSSDRRIKVNDDEQCRPFTDAELQQYGEKVEGIDRSAMGGSARDVRVIATGAAAAAMRSPGGSHRPMISADQQASDAAAVAAEHVFEAPAESATREAEAESAAAGEPVGAGRARGRR